MSMDAVSEAERIVEEAFTEVAGELGSYLNDRENLPPTVRADLDYLDELETVVDELLYAIQHDDQKGVDSSMTRLLELRADDEDDLYDDDGNRK